MSDDKEPYKERANKSALKRESHSITELGQKFSALSDKTRSQVSLPDELTKAINDYIRTKSFIAKKRQGQYLGKILRRQSEELITSLQLIVESSENHKAVMDATFHLTEKWREQLLSDKSASYLTQFISDYPNADRQRLRHLIQKAQKEKKEDKNLGHSKTLFRYIRELIDA